MTNATYLAAAASLPAAVVLAAAVYEVTKTAYWRWAYRHIPGPTPALLGGNLAGIMKAGGLPTALQQWRQEYGTVYKLFLMGKVAVVVASPADVRLVLSKAVDRPGITQPLYLLSTGGFRRFIDASVLAANGPTWRALRVAWNQTLSSGLSSFMVPMKACAVSLCEAIKTHLNGGYFDISDLLARMTVDVVGTCAYGVEFNALEPAGGTHAGIGSALTKACQGVGTSGYGSSWWAFVYAALPVLQPLLAFFSSLYPGPNLGRQRQGIIDLAFYSDGLIRAIGGARTAQQLAKHPTELKSTSDRSLHACSRPKVRFLRHRH